MKVLFFVLLTTIITSGVFAQVKKDSVKPFSITLNEGEANRIYSLLGQFRFIVPKSEVPFKDGVALINDADSAMQIFSKSYSIWQSKNKPDTAKKK